MSKFRFSVSNVESHREGIIESDTFTDAVDNLGHHVDVNKGDVLEIGVFGFPPARYECVGKLRASQPIWMPAGKMAA